jgi:integrase
MANIQSLLRKALDDAIEDELIEVNPLARWCYSKVEAPQSKDDIDPFTKEEQAAILTQATGQGRNLLQFAFWTACARPNWWPWTGPTWTSYAAL